MIPVKNYTSQIPPSRTIQTIKNLLVESGAMSIKEDYEGGKIKAVSFLIKTDLSEQSAITLPADPKGVFEYLKLARVRYMSTAQVKALQEQSERTAWRLMEDWLRVQLSLVAMKQASFGQIFLPYMLANGQGQTVYEMIRSGKMLGPKNGEPS